MKNLFRKTKECSEIEVIKNKKNHRKKHKKSLKKKSQNFKAKKILGITVETAVNNRIKNKIASIQKIILEF